MEPEFSRWEPLLCWDSLLYYTALLNKFVALCCHLLYIYLIKIELTMNVKELFDISIKDCGYIRHELFMYLPYSIKWSKTLSYPNLIIYISRMKTWICNIIGWKKENSPFIIVDPYIVSTRVIIFLKIWSLMPMFNADIMLMVINSSPL